MVSKALLAQLAILSLAHGLDAPPTLHPPAAVAYVRALQNGAADPLAAVWANASVRGQKPIAYVHWDFPKAAVKNAEIEHTWRSLPGGWDGNSIFMSQYIALTDGGGGYFGTQMHGGLGHISEASLTIFSLWDCKTGEQTKGWGANCKHQCTGEGCFTQCRTTAAIQQNVKYLQEIKFHHYDGKYTWWEWFINKQSLGQIGSPSCNGQQGGGDILLNGAKGGIGGFMEYPSDTPVGDCNAAHCKVEWRGPWYNQRSIMPKQAYAEYGTGAAGKCSTSSVSGAGGSSVNPIVTLEGGKGTVRTTRTWQALWSGENEKNSTLIV